MKRWHIALVTGMALAVVALLAWGGVTIAADAASQAEYTACLDRNAWLESGQALHNMCSGYLR